MLASSLFPPGRMPDTTKYNRYPPGCVHARGFQPQSSLPGGVAVQSCFGFSNQNKPDSSRANASSGRSFSRFSCMDRSYRQTQIRPPRHQSKTGKLIFDCVSPLSLFRRTEAGGPWKDEIGSFLPRPPLPPPPPPPPPLEIHPFSSALA